MKTSIHTLASYTFSQGIQSWLCLSYVCAPVNMINAKNDERDEVCFT